MLTSYVTVKGEPVLSLRTARYRYIHYPDGTCELYDHHHDPHEHTNLGTDPQYQDLIQELRSLLPDKVEKTIGGRLG